MASKKQSAPIEVDYLDYVQRAIPSIPRGQKTSIAAEAGVCGRTIELVAAGTYDPKYKNVKNLYDVLKRRGIKPAGVVE